MTKNIHSCKDPIHDMLKSERDKSWWVEYHVWNVPKALSCPKEQKRARNPPKTASQALSLSFVSLSAACIRGVSACNVLFGGETSVVPSKLDLRVGSDDCFSISAIGFVVPAR